MRPTTPSSSGSGGRIGVNPGSPTGSRCSWAIPDRADCAGKFYNGRGITPDIYVLFDVSGSMATRDDGTLMRIDAVRDALESFLNDPGSSGIGVGIGYFGTQPLSCACTSCDPADYATPAVAIDALPGQLRALTTSLGGATPTGETPTGAALRGACGYAGGYKQAHPGHDVVLLLVTDGEPQAPLTSRAGTCNPTLADATAAASACLTGGLPVRTYVLGVGPSLTNLNQIAAAGGTRSAHLVAGGGAASAIAVAGAAMGEPVAAPALLRAHHRHRTHRLANAPRLGDLPAQVAGLGGRRALDPDAVLVEVGAHGVGQPLSVEGRRRSDHHVDRRRPLDRQGRHAEREP